jgi:Polysaccharide deacetylase
MLLRKCLPFLLPLVHTALCHSEIGLLGGIDAVRSLQQREALYFDPREYHVMQRRAEHPPEEVHLDERAVNLRCGPTNGSCPTGYWCVGTPSRNRNNADNKQLLNWRLLVIEKVSPELKCVDADSFHSGKDYHYCSGPACQLSYGDLCDGNISPAGTTTIDVPRPHLGNLSYGGLGSYYCVNKSHVALTFDDGPYIFTEKVLDVLDQYNAKATFFITGNNMGKGQVDNVSTGYPQLLKRMHESGHQIASHTWTHQNLTALTVQQRQNQMYYNEMAFRNVLGFFPTYMRPPYSECDNDTQDMLSSMGYHVIYYNIDPSGASNSSHPTSNIKQYLTSHLRLPERLPRANPELKGCNRHPIRHRERNSRLPSRFHRHQPRHSQPDR